MIATPLKFAVGDVIVIRGLDKRESLWRTLRRRGGGYDMEPLVDGERRLWSDTELDEALRDRRLRHIPYDTSGLSKNASTALSRTWEYWSETDRREALRRLEYVRRVDAIAPLRIGPYGDPDQARRRERCIRAGELLEVYIGRVASLKHAYAAAASDIWEEHKVEWLKAEELASGYAEKEDEKKKRLVPRKPRATRKPIDEPSPSAIRDWWFRWDESNGDLRSLIPYHHAKGCREPFYKETTAGGETTYRIMAWAIDEHYCHVTRPNMKGIWRDYYKKRCEANHLPHVSYETFRLFVNLGNCPFDVFSRRYGRRAATKRYKIYQRTTPPERPLEEVEVDHCLIDIVVRHPRTKRILGRPWLTCLIDRATRAILGCHLSFEVPSYSSLQRALAHSFWRKDISVVDGIDGDWPMHGIPEWIFTDNGREFRSASLRLTEAMLDFAVVNLPVKQPELKGMCERIFQTMGVQIFSLEEGSVLARSDVYDPGEKSELSLTEVTFKIVKWIVDIYHNEPHPTLKKRTPNEMWAEKTALYPVRPVPDFDHIIRMTGADLPRQISNVGVHYEGYLFSDPEELERLRRRGGLDREWTIRVDPYNYGEIWIFDELDGQWISLPNADPAISVGVSRFQHRLHIRRAKRLAARRGSKVVTTQDILNAKLAIEAEADAAMAKGKRTGAGSMAARYQTNGEFFTPFYDGGMLRSTLSPAKPTAEAEATALAAPGTALGDCSTTLSVGDATPCSVPLTPKDPETKQSNKLPSWADLEAEASALIDAW